MLALEDACPMKPITESTDGNNNHHSTDDLPMQKTCTKFFGMRICTHSQVIILQRQAELADRYEKLESRRSPDGGQWWLNWVIKKVETDELIGYVQATVAKGLLTLLGWLVLGHQRNGYATMATKLMVDQLAAMDCQAFSCHIKPGHVFSNRVAQKLAQLRPN